MCLKCLNPRYTLETGAERLAHEHNDCSVAKRKKRSKYTCLYGECFLLSWVCTLHPDTNRALLETHARDFIKKRQYSAFVHPGFAGPGVKLWHSDTPCKRSDIAQPDPNQPFTSVPTAHQASRFKVVTNDGIPDDGLELPVMLPRPEDLTTVDVFTTVAAFTRGLLDYWNTHGHLQLASTD